MWTPNAGTDTTIISARAGDTLTTPETSQAAR